MFSEEVLQALEYERILDKLAGETHGPEAAEAALRTRPSSDVEVIENLLDETSEIERHLQEGRTIPVERVGDCRPVLSRLTKVHAVLDGPMLVILRDMLSISARCRNFFCSSEKKSELKLPLAELAETIDIPSSYQKELLRCVEDNGDIKSEASPGLSKARKSVYESRDRILGRFNKIIGSPKLRKHLQEPTVMIRNGRYVLPVKRVARAGLAGIVQDQSSSGETLFIEPYSLVSLNNACQEARLAEAREVYKVLEKLTAQAVEIYESIKEAASFAVKVDIAHARASLAYKMNAYRPEMSSDGSLKLLSAKHPLLRGEVVPINVNLESGRRCMVISGPNTGGKTLAMKTTGLLSAMRQSGMFVPAAPDSSMPVYRRIFCDIGDMQSIERDLSTFSAHLMRMAEFLVEAQEDDLVLVDEIGSGTDPREGNALSLAVLDSMIKRNVTVMVTTHQPAIKEYAFRREGAVNAAVAYDYKEMKPLYYLIRGALGRSHAFMIAKRMGFPDSVLEIAGSHLSRDDMRVEDLISRLENELSQVEEEGRNLAERSEEAEKAKTQYEENLARHEEGLKSDLSQELSETLEHYRSERKRLQALMSEFSSMTKAARKWQNSRVTGGSEKETSLSENNTSILVEETSISEKAKVLNKTLKEAEKETARVRKSIGKPGEGEFVEGCRVKIAGTSLNGNIIECRGNRFKVDCRDRSMWVNRAQLELMEEQPKSDIRPYDKEQVVINVAGPEKLVMELMLIGQDSETAARRLEEYIDDAVSAGLSSVRIIHGFGRGILKRMVADFLSSNPMVLSFRSGGSNEGGLGATVAELKRV